MSSTHPPVVFIHGLWLPWNSWAPWQEHFARAGYESVAPKWPGEREDIDRARADPDSIAGRGIDDLVEHFVALIDAMEERPIIIGHSLGGMVAERLLGANEGVAAIAIDPAPIKGVLAVPFSALRSTMPVLRRPTNRHKAVSLTENQFRYGFANAVSEGESRELFRRWAVPAPGRPVFEAATANLRRRSPAQVATDNTERGPLLLVTGGRDHTVPKAMIRSTRNRYRRSTAVTDLIEFPDRGHSLTIDSGWRTVADTCLSWLAEHDL